MSAIFKPIYKPIFKPVRDPLLPGTIQKTISSMICRFYAPTFIGTNPLTEWQNRNYGADAFDLDVPVGTGANLSLLDSGVALHPGASGDFWSTPDTPAASVTDDITLEWIGYMFDWTPGATMALVSKYNTGPNHRSYLLQILNTGLVRLVLSVDGTATVTTGSSEAPGFTGGELGGVRAKWNNSANEITYEKSSDGVIWTPFGTNPQTLTAAGIDDNASLVEIGSFSGGASDLLAGKTVRARVYNDATATNVVVDFDLSKATDTNSATFTSGGVVWTRNGDAFVNASGHTGLYSRGGVGLESTAGQLLVSPITIISAFKPTLASPGDDQYIFDSRSNAAASMSLRSDESSSDKYTMNQGSDIALSQAYDNDSQIYTCQFKGGATAKFTADAGSVIGNAGSENFDFGSILMALGGGSTIQGIFYEHLIADRSLSEAEIANIQLYASNEYA